MIQLTLDQFENIRLTLVQIASIAGSQGISEIVILAEGALSELRHGALDSGEPSAIGIQHLPDDYTKPATKPTETE